MRKGYQSCWADVAERVEARRKLVVGQMEAAIKHFKGYNVEKSFHLFLVFLLQGNKRLLGWQSLSHRTKKDLPRSQWYTEEICF